MRHLSGLPTSSHDRSAQGPVVIELAVKSRGVVYEASAATISASTCVDCTSAINSSTSISWIALDNKPSVSCLTARSTTWPSVTASDP